MARGRIRRWLSGGTAPRCALSPPAAPGDFPDPFVLATGGGGYLAYATNAGGHHVQVRRSRDLLTWQAAPDALPELPAWARAGRTWSPAVVAGAGGYALWYAVTEARSGHQVISVATSGDPAGPFEDRSGGPVVDQAELGGSIDPSPFTDVDGTAYLLWKADANAVGRRASLWAQRLAEDRTTLTGSPSLLLVTDRSWERPLIEAPCMWRQGGRYWLFYSARRWNSAGYAIGLAEANAALGPWTKRSTRGPWVASDSAGAGPGGQEVFGAYDGTVMLAYHAWEPGRVTYRAGGERSLRIGTLDLSGELPVLRPGR